MDELNPIYRIEFFLDAIVNSTTPPEPIYRVEFYLAKIAGADVEIPEPVYRMEKYLAYLCGEEVELPDPIYRIEYYLAFLCGLNVELPEPIYRVEFWLWDWCGGGGIEKTIIGNPIHITDALAKPAQALSVKLEPIQDLHGYNNPWPAGGGKNKFNVEALPMKPETPTANTWKDGNGGIFVKTPPSSGGVAAYIDGYGYAKLSDLAPNLVVGNTYVLSFTSTGTQKQIYLSVSGLVWKPNETRVITQDDLDSVVYFYASGVDTEATITKFQIEQGSTATTFAPYSNICPISGHTDADVTRTGKNLVYEILQGKTIGGTGEISNAGTYSMACARIKKGQTYKITSDENQFVGGFFTGQPALHSITYNGARIVQESTVFTAPIDGYVAFRITLNYATPQLELGSTASSFEPYVGTTYPIPLGQTVYGGQLDVVNGKIYARPYYPSYNGETLVGPWVSSMDKYEEGATPTTGAQVVDMGGTVTEISLTPEEITLLEGENNLWSDAGDMTLTYYADGNASEIEALNILLGNRYYNNHEADEPTDREALQILLGGNR